MIHLQVFDLDLDRALLTARSKSGASKAGVSGQTCIQQTSGDALQAIRLPKSHSQRFAGSEIGRGAGQTPEK